MTKYHILLFSIFCTLFCSCIKEESTKSFVYIKGGIFKNSTSHLYGKNVIVADFYMGKYEITQKEWKEIMVNSPSKFKGENLPVEMVSWYNCVEYCNKRSIKEELEPYYNITKNLKDTLNKNNLDSIKWIITINPNANGYRLPTEVEWEYAASGGQKSKNYAFSGNSNINESAWYWKNSGDSLLTGHWLWINIENNNCKTHPVGLKEPNELGLYDMSGNIREWCEDWYQDEHTTRGLVRCQRGGGWIGGEHTFAINYRGSFEANGVGPDQGFRICRSAI